ncbi:MAG: hypothetical protein GF416_05760 [Candidatus Altiarchaeales archaeon]|nr:hypothetical protein [Candidatus Altiarchaeales archaeon]MBD3416621.1 hypothetical protein [Candidatus Altiarchaeales archaeon]
MFFSLPGQILLMHRVYAVDFDGTLCDTSSLKQEYLLNNHGVIVCPCNTNRTYLTREKGHISEEDYDAMVEFVGSREATLSAKPVPGAVEAVKRMSESGRVFILTARRGSQLDSAREWSRKNGLEDFIEGYISSRHFTEDKMRICSSLNIRYLIDDDPGNLDQRSQEVEGIIFRNGCALEDSMSAACAVDWQQALAYMQ